MISIRLPCAQLYEDGFDTCPVGTKNGRFGLTYMGNIRPCLLATERSWIARLKKKHSASPIFSPFGYFGSVTSCQLV